MQGKWIHKWICSKRRVSKDKKLYWACIFYIEHNARSKEQEREFISDMTGSAECLWFSTSSLNRKNVGKFLDP